VVAKTGKKVEMARGLSKLHVLPLRAHDPGELMEYWARNSSPALTHALAKHIWGTDFLFRDSRHVCNIVVGYLEG
jgi:hypothetical protein